MVTITTLGGGEGSHRLEGLQGPLEGYLNLHDDHVRGELVDQLEGLPVVWDLGDDLHAPVGGEYAGQALAEHGVVVGKQHPDRPVRVRVRDLVLSQCLLLRSVGASGRHCSVYTFSGHGSSPLLRYDGTHSYGAPSKFEGYSPEYVE